APWSWVSTCGERLRAPGEPKAESLLSVRISAVFARPGALLPIHIVPALRTHAVLAAAFILVNHLVLVFRLVLLIVVLLVRRLLILRRRDARQRDGARERDCGEARSAQKTPAIHPLLFELLE